MDPRIEALLRSTTYFGRRLTRQQISDIQATVAAFPALSRHELGQTICEQLGWRTGTGTNRIPMLAVPTRLWQHHSASDVLTTPEARPSSRFSQVA